jgi:hypothetical protein
MHDVEGWDRTCFGRLADADGAAAAPDAATAAATATSEEQAAAAAAAAAAADNSAEMTQLSPQICSTIMALEQVCVCVCVFRQGGGGRVPHVQLACISHSDATAIQTTRTLPQAPD